MGKAVAADAVALPYYWGGMQSARGAIRIILTMITSQTYLFTFLYITANWVSSATLGKSEFYSF